MPADSRTCCSGFSSSGVKATLGSSGAGANATGATATGFAGAAAAGIKLAAADSEGCWTAPLLRSLLFERGGREPRPPDCGLALRAVKLAVSSLVGMVADDPAMPDGGHAPPAE